MNQVKFPFSPCELNEYDFIQVFGGVYEHSPWVAEQTRQRGLDESHDVVEVLAIALANTVDAADAAQRLALIVSHPDLAGRAAQRGELTSESTTEQASAGIDQCNEEEFERFQKFNAAYKEKFNFPFVMAVKGSNRHIILAAFEQRLENDYQAEFNRAISEIHKIARFRLDDIVLSSNKKKNNEQG